MQWSIPPDKGRLLIGPQLQSDNPNVVADASIGTVLNSGVETITYVYQPFSAVSRSERAYITVERACLLLLASALSVSAPQTGPSLQHLGSRRR